VLLTPVHKHVFPFDCVARRSATARGGGNGLSPSPAYTRTLAPHMRDAPRPPTPWPSLSGPRYGGSGRHHHPPTTSPTTPRPFITQTNAPLSPTNTPSKAISSRLPSLAATHPHFPTARLTSPALPPGGEFPRYYSFPQVESPPFPVPTRPLLWAASQVFDDWF